MRALVVMVIGLSLAGCNRDIDVVTIQDGARIYTDLGSKSGILYTASLGERFKAEKPPNAEPKFWWVKTKNGTGVASQQLMARYPVKGEPFVVVSFSSEKRRATRDGEVHTTHGAGAVLSLAKLAGVEEPYLAVVVNGSVVGFVDGNSVKPQ